MEISAEVLREMFHTRPPIVKYFGMKLDFDENNQTTIILPYNPNLDHGEGAIHGGVIATIVDNARAYILKLQFWRLCFLS